MLYIVNEGQTPVYMHRAYGREPGHFYLAALVHGLSGHALNFDLLKLTTALEGFVVILVAFWMGRALFYEEDRQFGIIVGLLAALFIATGWWPLNIARSGLRAISMTAIVGITCLYMARVMRHQRLTDYMLAGAAGEQKWDIVTVTSEFKPNYIARLQFFKDDPRYTLRPNLNVLFFYNGDDAPAAALLQKLFPSGKTTEVTTPGSPRAFYVYEAPPGCKWFMEQLPDWQPPSCAQAETTEK